MFIVPQGKTRKHAYSTIMPLLDHLDRCSLNHSVRLVLHEVYTAPVSHVELLCSLHIKSNLDMATCVLHV